MNVSCSKLEFKSRINDEMFGALVSEMSMHSLRSEELILLPEVSLNADGKNDKKMVLPIVTKDVILMLSASDPRSTVMMEPLGPLITDALVKVILSSPMEVFARVTLEGLKLTTSTGSSKCSNSWSNDRSKVQLSIVGGVVSRIILFS